MPSDFQFSLKLKDSKATVKRHILEAFAKALKKKYFTYKTKMKLLNRTKVILRANLENQKEYEELIRDDGALRTELGIPNQKSAVKDLIRAWVDSVQIIMTTPVVTGNAIKATFTLYAIKADFSDVLSQGYASYRADGQDIPWLQWLLLEGDKIIISTHSIAFIPALVKFSRTKSSVMVKSKKGWAIPSAYSGVMDDNFATRAVDDAYGGIKRLFIQTFKS